VHIVHTQFWLGGHVWTLSPTPLEGHSAGPRPRHLNPPPTQLHRPPGTARGQRHRDPGRGQCPHVKAKTPLTRGNAVPKVGLEPDSSPCKRWAPPETYGNRPDPTDVRPSPTAKVCTMCTPQNSPLCARKRQPRSQLREGGWPLCSTSSPDLESSVWSVGTAWLIESNDPLIPLFLQSLETLGGRTQPAR